VFAFEHLYKLGFVHRDVKPSNILLCSSNPAHVRLVDFGIARHIGRDVATTPEKMYDPVKDNKFILGTLNFCSLNSHAGYGENEFKVQQ
jgi:serine/threonine protein kinase